MDHQLANKRALVTGGSRGIGAAVVKRLAREGAHVALSYVSNPDQATKTMKAVEALGVKALAIQADSADAGAVVAAVNQTVSECRQGGHSLIVPTGFHPPMHIGGHGKALCPPCYIKPEYVIVFSLRV